MARTVPCAAPSLFVLLLLPLVAAACPTSPMSPAASTYGYEAMSGTAPAAYPSPFVAAPGAAPPAATAPPRAEGEPPVRDRGQEELLMRQGGAVGGDHVQRLDHLARVLDFLGYREMASAAPLLVSSPVLASWPGAWTVFAIPDAAFRAGCPGRARACTQVLMEHVALGGTVRSDVAAEPYSSTKLSTAAIGMCITASASTKGPKTLWVNGVEVSEPDLYNDGPLVIHGIKGLMKLPRRRSCSIDRSRRHRLGRQDRAEELFRDIFALVAA